MTFFWNNLATIASPLPYISKKKKNKNWNSTYSSTHSLVQKIWLNGSKVRPRPALSLITNSLRFCFVFLNTFTSVRKTYSISLLPSFLHLMQLMLRICEIIGIPYFLIYFISILNMLKIWNYRLEIEQWPTYSPTKNYYCVIYSTIKISLYISPRTPQKKAWILLSREQKMKFAKKIKFCPLTRDRRMFTFANKLFHLLRT